MSSLQQPLPFTVLKPTKPFWITRLFIIKLQQPLPFTVLKPEFRTSLLLHLFVATALTVYGIETFFDILIVREHTSIVATALTVYGIETISLLIVSPPVLHDVATALTVYGIETMTRQHVEI